MTLASQDFTEFNLQDEIRTKEIFLVIEWYVNKKHLWYGEWLMAAVIHRPLP